MDYSFFFIYLKEVPPILKKTKAFVKEKFLIHPTQVTGSTFCGIVIQTMHISKIST